MSLKSINSLKLLRTLLNEIRLISSSKKIKDSLQVRYIMDQYQKYKTTDLQLCKAQEEVQFLASTYLCYLESSRLANKIHTDFKGQGERSVAETAKMVGYKLPHDPK